MHPANLPASFHIRNGAGYADCPVITPGAQPQPFKGILQQLPGILLHRAEFLHIRDGYLAVIGNAAPGKTLPLDFLDGLDARRVRFGLSNVLRSRGRENRILLNWLEDRRDRYQALRLRYSYANSSYHIKDRSLVTEEVLIVNYTPEGTQRNL